MDTTKKSAEQVPFLERPIVRTVLPIAGFVIICVLFAFLTDGRLFQPKNLSLLLSQSYMLLISSVEISVFSRRDTGVNVGTAHSEDGRFNS